MAPNSAFCVEGCERQYCGGASTWPPSAAAACQPQRQVVEHAAGERDHVGLPAAQDVFGLVRIGDQADRDRGQARLTPHLGRERRMVAGPDIEFLVRRQPATRHVDEIATVRFEDLCVFDGLDEIPAAFDAIRAGDAHAERFRRRPRGAHRIEHVDGIAHAALEIAAVAIVAVIAERRQEFVQQKAMRAVDFDRIEADAVGPARRLDKGVLDARKAALVERLRHREFEIEGDRRGRDRLPAAVLDRHGTHSFPGNVG